jgi:hypothetical protein
MVFVFFSVGFTSCFRLLAKKQHNFGKKTQNNKKQVFGTARPPPLSTYWTFPIPKSGAISSFI